MGLMFIQKIHQKIRLPNVILTNVYRLITSSLRSPSITIIANALIQFTQTCKENDLKAGMGISAAIKNANMLLNDVKNTLTPVLARQYTAGS